MRIEGPVDHDGAGGAERPANPDVTAAYAYARCMRSHGVPNFPDPHVTISPGHGSVGFAVDPSETGSPQFELRSEDMLEDPPGATEPGQERAQQQAKKRNLLAFAQCVRANGVHDFPDPDAQGQLPLPTVIAAGVDLHSRPFLDAATACVGVTHGTITVAQSEAG